MSEVDKEVGVALGRRAWFRGGGAWRRLAQVGGGFAVAVAGLTAAGQPLRPPPATVSAPAVTESVPAVSTAAPLPVPAVVPPAPSALPPTGVRARVQPPPAAAEERRPRQLSYTPADVELIARVIHGEADDEPLDAEIGVGAVVVNRVRAVGFADTISGVILAPYQFQAVGAPLFEEPPLSVDLHAALLALGGDDPTGGALFFYNPATTWKGSWIWTTRTLVTYGDVRFSI